MRKKFKISNFSKIALTILIKFCGFILHSKPNNVILANFPGKIPETVKIYSYFFPSASSGPIPTHQSRSNSICKFLLQISLAITFVFDLPLKLSVVHIRKNYKIFYFPKNGSNEIHQIFLGLQYTRNPITWHFRLFPKKSLKLKKYMLNVFRLLTQGINQLINLVQTPYVGFSCKYF